MTELSEVIRRRRMVRSFSGRSVEPAVLEAVISSARRAPTAGNVDGWELLVLEGPHQTAQFWEATTTANWRDRSRRWPGFSRAPVVLCVFVRPLAYLERYDEADKHGSGLGASESNDDTSSWPVPFWFFDAGGVVLSMLLCAVDAGLGTCFLGNFRGENELRARFGVPEGLSYVGAVLIGEAGGSDPPSPSLTRTRLQLDDLVHRGNW